MINQVEENDIVAEFGGWVAVNVITILFLSFSIYFSDSITLHRFVSNKFIAQVLGFAGNSSFFGGGFILAGFQWICLRNHNPQIAGGGWVWVGSGLVSSIACFFSFGVVANVVGGNNYIFTILLVSGHVILLSIVHALVLHANKYQTVSRWAISNIAGYSLIVILSSILIGRGASDFEVLMISLIILIPIHTYERMGVYPNSQTRDDSKVAN